MGIVTIKRGDTLLISGVYKQSNGNPMSLVGCQLEVNIINAATDRSVLAIVSGPERVGKRLTIVNASTGAFELVIKDTAMLNNAEYWIDFKTVSSSGIEQTSKAIKLSVKPRL